MPTSEDLPAASPLVVALELRENALLGCFFSWSMRPCFIASSICTPISCKSEKIAVIPDRVRPNNDSFCNLVRPIGLSMSENSLKCTMGSSDPSKRSMYGILNRFGSVTAESELGFHYAYSGFKQPIIGYHEFESSSPISPAESPETVDVSERPGRMSPETLTRCQRPRVRHHQSCLGSGTWVRLGKKLKTELKHTETYTKASQSLAKIMLEQGSTPKACYDLNMALQDIFLTSWAEVGPFGQKLNASMSASNWSQGLYSLAFFERGLYSLAIHPNPDPYSYVSYGQDYSLLVYVEFNPSWVYFQSYLNANSNHQKILHVGSSTQLMRLELDGHLRVYEWVADNWNVVDLLTSDIGDCGYPMACGNYDICYSNGQCGCLKETPNSNTFRQINSRQPSLGCSLVTPISCNHSQYHTLLELQNTSYFCNLKDTNGYYLDAKIELEDCKKSCLKNCSCKATLFAHNYNYNRCLLQFEVYSFINNEAGDDSNSLTAQYPLPTNSPKKKSRNVTITLRSSLGALFGVFFVIASCIFHFRKKGESEEFDEFSVDQVPGCLLDSHTKT
ncbi:hypothetical protein HYC85_015147 [Camellia sinensis]|uniref:Apple domain-containing protein n=1 Tax=Camellia sinensis TaxID=4442 RepID=A0A7J7H8E6_CAMSI|nr:hypothetical protein HYC85_015147 [Camellia sinensis]